MLGCPVGCTIVLARTGKIHLGCCCGSYLACGFSCLLHTEDFVCGVWQNSQRPQLPLNSSSLTATCSLAMPGGPRHQVLPDPPWTLSKTFQCAELTAEAGSTWESSQPDSSLPCPCYTSLSPLRATTAMVPAAGGWKLQETQGNRAEP